MIRKCISAPCLLFHLIKLKDLKTSFLKIKCLIILLIFQQSQEGAKAKVKKPESTPSQPKGWKPASTQWTPPDLDYTPPKSSWTPPKEDYQPPKQDWKPPTSDYKPPKSEWKPPTTEVKIPQSTWKPDDCIDGAPAPPPAEVQTPEQAQAQAPAPKETGPMARLMEMGFIDRELNEQLLKKHKNSLDRVIQELLTSKNSDWSF